MIAMQEVNDILFNTTVKREEDNRVDLVYLITLKDRAFYAKAYIDEDFEVQITADEEIDQEIEDAVYVKALSKWREINAMP